MSRDDGNAGGGGARDNEDPREGQADDLAKEPAPPEPADDGDQIEHVEVRRARPPGQVSVFGDTPIAGPVRPGAAEDPEEPEEPEEPEDLGAWVRHAAMVAALRAGAQACVVGIFMGIVLGFFLSGLMSGTGLLLGLILCVGSVPVAFLAGFATYRQTLESERQRQGLCPRCGYDLRGLNTARCPECGAKLRPPRAWLAQSDRPGDEEEESP